MTVMHCVISTMTDIQTFDTHTHKQTDMLAHTGYRADLVQVGTCDMWMETGDPSLFCCDEGGKAQRWLTVHGSVLGVL